jgi:hypothetical protein
MGKVKELVIEVANHYGIPPSEVDEAIMKKYMREKISNK